MAEPIETIRVQADWDRDGSFDHVLTDITAYVLACDWTLGNDTPYSVMGGPCQMTLVLDNKDGAWNVSKTGATFAAVFQPDVMIRVQYYYAAQWFHLVVLKIAAISFAPGRFGPRTVTVTCTDWTADLMATIYDAPLTTNTTTGTAIRAAFQEGGLVGYPTANMWWILDASVLDTSTILPEYLTSGYAFFHNGSTTLDYVGDNLDRGTGTSLLAFIEEMCAAEMQGRFRLEVNTVLGLPYYKFHGRNTLAEYYNNAGTFTISLGEVDNAEYVYGQNWCNQVGVTVYPRKVGDTGTVIARIESPMMIPGTELGNKPSVNSTSNSRTFTLRYRDPDNPQGTCAATAVIQPVATTDYTGNLAADGSGADYTSNLVVTVINETNAAQVTVANTALGAVYLTLLKIRGTPLTAQQPLELTASDGAAIGAYGLVKSSMTIAGVDDAELVQSFADHYVQTHSTPRTEIRSITFAFTGETSAALHQFVREPLSDTRPLYITDDWLEDTTDAVPHWVCGMRNTLDAQARTWTVTLLLEDMSYAAQAWKLEDTDLSVLGTTTRLSF